MVAKWEAGFKVVYGVRGKRKGENPIKLVTAKIFYRLIRWIGDTDMPLDAGDFRLLDRKVVATLRSIREENRYIRGLVSWAGFPAGRRPLHPGPPLRGPDEVHAEEDGPVRLRRPPQASRTSR